ncbi:MAG TPA: hypothetical protein VI636_04170 [Candidatus Angelobacter sp.]
MKTSLKLIIAVAVIALAVVLPQIHSYYDASGTVRWATGSGCNSGTSQCSQELTWSGGGFSDSNYTAVCSANYTVNGAVSQTTETGTHITAVMTTTDGTSAYSDGFECIGVHH